MKRLLIIIVILILIAGILYFLVWRAKPTKVVGPEVIAPPTSPESETTTSSPAIDPVVLLKSELTIRARAFIERYGSYSSDIGYVYLEELIPSMSQRLAEETRAYLNQKKSEQKTSQPFYGLTTKVLAIELKDFIPDVSADFFASCQQEETKGTATTIFYKKANLKMIFENNGWKVDEIIIQ